MLTLHWRYSYGVFPQKEYTVRPLNRQSLGLYAFPCLGTPQSLARVQSGAM